MTFRTVRHEDLTDLDARRIAALKDQHWTHGEASQLAWMAENVRPGDLHLMGEEPADGGVRLSAYMTLTRLQVRLDQTELDAWGVGCVCVDQTALHSGLGKQLVLEANRLIRDRQAPGFLLCKDSLVGFYQKCGWSPLSYQTASVAGVPYDKRMMTLTKTADAGFVQIDRNF